MENNICIYCNHLNRLNNKYCTQCGALLIKHRFSGPRLVMLHGDRHDAIFQLSKEPNSIGRGENNSIVLADGQISKQHGQIKFENDEYWIEDLNSRNGVFINGRKINHRERLYHGCLVKIGATILRFETTRYI
jgi:pSer/pThr/pTyr-binding forkhead associated (FHA) protein